jgi:methionine-rich copper-binding protein CopC
MSGRMGGRLAGLALLVASVLSARSAVSAYAAADLIEAQPAAGSTVSGSPASIRLSFSQPLVSGSTVALFTGQFQQVGGLSTVVAGSELQATLAQPLAPATYTVQWVAATDDGATAQGSYQFAVAAGNPFTSGRYTPLIAALATIVTGAVAVLVFILSRRQRL